MSEQFPIGVDVGGTFTDLVALGPGNTLVVRKVPSTPDDYSRGICQAIQALTDEGLLPPREISMIIHAATVSTNAILTGSGARVGLITTHGFRDVLEIRRLRMPRLYDMTWEKPPTLVPRYLRLEVAERINHKGEVLRHLDLKHAESAVRALLERGVESIAVCLINSYANPRHEEILGELISRMAPQVGLSLSHQVLPEIKEYERTSTTVINAYVKPVMRGYVENLMQRVKDMGITAPIMIMQSSGGMMTDRAAVERPVFTIESGPAAGVMGAVRLGTRMGLPNLISFDMGGTTAKASLVEGGQPRLCAEFEVGAEVNVGHRLLKGGGYLVRASSVDLAEVGAGGGSIAWVDKGGALRVGPHSAGAAPGPACYELGGEAATVTDANVVLGYLNPDYLTGGTLPIKSDLSHRALGEQVAVPLGMEVHQAAYGVHTIGNANMLRVIRAVSSEIGRDPREFALFAFGGSGPVHAASLARSLGIRQVVIPPAPGLFSALGLLFTDVEHRWVKTFWCRTREADLDEMNLVLCQIEEEAKATLRAEGFPNSRVEVRRQVDMRYEGQNSEITLPIPGDPVTATEVEALEEAFSQEHLQTYGYNSLEEPVQFLNLRLLARGRALKPVVPDQMHMAGGPVTTAGNPQPRTRRAYFGSDAGWLDTPVLRRHDLSQEPRPGPLIVEEYDATTVVPPGCRVRLDYLNNIVLDLS